MQERQGMIKVMVHTILGIKKIIGRGDIEVSLPEESPLISLLSHLVKTYGEDLSSYLYGENKTELLPHIRVMVNGRDIEFLNGTGTVLKDRDEILILPPVSGG
jgi:molybdopterin synthase sulfur carrier subunit